MSMLLQNLQNPQQMQALMQHLGPLLQGQQGGATQPQQQPNTMLPPAVNKPPTAINPQQPGVLGAPPAVTPAIYPNNMHPLASGAPNAPAGYPNIMHSLAPGA
jgi:hypothetical protein